MVYVNMCGNVCVDAHACVFGGLRLISSVFIEEEPHLNPVLDMSGIAGSCHTLRHSWLLGKRSSMRVCERL